MVPADGLVGERAEDAVHDEASRPFTGVGQVAEVNLLLHGHHRLALVALTHLMISTGQVMGPTIPSVQAVGRLKGANGAVRDRPEDAVGFEVVAMRSQQTLQQLHWMAIIALPNERPIRHLFE